MKKKLPNPETIREALIDGYPTKVARKRSKQIVVNRKTDEGVPQINANTRTVPGIITQRGCCYAGCKGVVLGPSRDIINITHGPIGCAFYSWLTRRNQTRPTSDEDHQFMTYMFSTDMEDKEIIFGGEKKLKQAIQEAYDNFHPRQIGVFATCPVGLIGDDIHAVCREMSDTLGINIFGFSCEGYKGVSQSAGHHIANNQLFKHVVGRSNAAVEGRYKINILGEYNIGGDAFLIDELLERCGITLHSCFSGNSTVEEFENAHMVDLNTVMCHRSINYIADMFEKRYGIPWIKVNFLGLEATAKSLRKIADYFEDEQLRARVEAVIAAELAKVEPVRAQVFERCQGKLAMMFVGGSRAHHYQELFKEIGMKTIAAGYEFAHRDDYEGRKVLPDIKVDADSRNIEEINVEPDPQMYAPRRSAEELEALARKGLPLKDYDGMMPEMGNETLVIDDISEHETELLLRTYRPAIFCAGIKEKYGVQKFGIPCKQLHSYDYGGPYAAFQGAANFFDEIDRMVNASVWSQLRPPWEMSMEPTLDAELGNTG